MPLSKPMQSGRGQKPQGPDSQGMPSSEFTEVNKKKIPVDLPSEMGT